MVSNLQYVFLVIRKTRAMRQQDGSSTSTRVGIKERRKFLKEK